METAINATKAFIATGSFWNTQLDKESSKDAKNVCSLPLYSNMLNSIDNCINNLASKGKQKAINKTLYFDPSTIAKFADNYTIDYKGDIDLANITVAINNGEIKTLKAAVDFKLLFGADKCFSKIEFITVDPNTFADTKFIVDGYYVACSNKFSSLLSSLININYIPCDERAKTISAYIGGSKQSPYDFYKAINYMCDCYSAGLNMSKITNVWEGVNVSNYTLSNNTKSVIITCPYNSTNLNRFMSVDGKGNNPNYIFDADNILNPNIEVQYPGSYNLAALGSNYTNYIDTTVVTKSMQLGNPIMLICFDSRLMKEEEIINMHSIISEIAPLGYTLNYFIKYIDNANNALKIKSYAEWLVS